VTRHAPSICGPDDPSAFTPFWVTVSDISVATITAASETQNNLFKNIIFSFLHMQWQWLTLRVSSLAGVAFDRGRLL
jgi:hypothetical protein